MQRIIGSKFNNVFRACDMLTLNLGNNVTRANGKTYPEYSIHVQTAWRFVNEDEILLAKSDIYLPLIQESADYERNFESLDRADSKNSVFDVLQKTINDHFTDAIVECVTVSTLGDLYITFNNGIVFQAIVDSSRNVEFWRFIDFTKVEPEHLVVYDI